LIADGFELGLADLDGGFELFGFGLEWVELGVERFVFFEDAIDVDEGDRECGIGGVQSDCCGGTNGEGTEQQFQVHWESPGCREEGKALTRPLRGHRLPEGEGFSSSLRTSWNHSLSMAGWKPAPRSSTLSSITSQSGSDCKKVRP
jgi:hypothetical protein